jgi:hypothetical protein
MDKNRFVDKKILGEHNMKIIDKQKMPIPEYEQYLIDHGYSREQLTIDENSEIVSVSSLEKGSAGTIVSIRCPSGYKIIIIGRSLKDKAHTIALRLANDNEIGGDEVAPDTRIRILKYKVSDARTVIDTMFYKDLTKTEYLKIIPNKTKINEKCDITAKSVYRFNDSIEINGNERLEIEAINPDIAIDAKNVMLELDIDLLEE